MWHFKKAALSTGDSPGGKRRATTSIGKDLPKPVGTAPIRCWWSSWSGPPKWYQPWFKEVSTQLFPEYTYYVAHSHKCSLNLKVAQHWWKGRMFSSQKSILFSHYVSPPQQLFIHLTVPDDVLIWNWLSCASDHLQNIFLCIGECKGRAEIYTRTKALTFNFS